MIKTLVVFLILTALIHLGIEGWRYATKKERWKAVKTLTYSAGLGIISLLVLTFVVVLF